MNWKIIIVIVKSIFFGAAQIIIKWDTKKKKSDAPRGRIETFLIST
jgi:hypothetical protein